MQFYFGSSNVEQKLCRWSDALDEVDTTIAERRPLDALQALRRIEKLVARPPVGQGDPLDTARIAQGEFARLVCGSHRLEPCLNRFLCPLDSAVCQTVNGWCDPLCNGKGTAWEMMEDRS